MRQYYQKKGFTLLELMIVVIIIGILATLALPRFRRATEAAKSAEAITNLGVLRDSEWRYQTLYDDFTTTLDDLDMDNPNNETNRKFNYTVASTSPSDFTITATFIADPTKTITLDEDGNLVKSGW